MKKFPEQRLPCCGYVVDSHSETIDGKGDIVEPKCGDYSVCIHCATILRFIDNNGTVRLASDSDEMDYNIAISLARAIMAVRKHNQVRDHMKERRN